jgi:hypothetical protein
LAQTKTVDYKGRKVEAEVVEFESQAEPWSQYLLKDGTTLRMKLVLLEIVRLVGEKNERGEPVYVFTAQQIVGTNTPTAEKTSDR